MWLCFHFYDNQTWQDGKAACNNLIFRVWLVTSPKLGHVTNDYDVTSTSIIPTTTGLQKKWTMRWSYLDVDYDVIIAT